MRSERVDARAEAAREVEMQALRDDLWWWRALAMLSSVAVAMLMLSNYTSSWLARAKEARARGRPVPPFLGQIGWIAVAFMVGVVRGARRRAAR